MTYSKEDRSYIAGLKPYKPRKNGRPRKDLAGTRLASGHVIVDCVGVSIKHGALGCVWRAKKPRSRSDFVLVAAKGLGLVEPEHLLTGIEITKAQLWQSILNKCFEPAHPYAKKGLKTHRRWVPRKLNGELSIQGTTPSRLTAFANFKRDLPGLLNGRRLRPGMQSSRFGDVGDYSVENFILVPAKLHRELTVETTKLRRSKKR